MRCGLRRRMPGLAAAALLAAATGCGERGAGRFLPGASARLVVVAGSENKELEPILQRFARRERVVLDIRYKGSVEMMLDLEQGRANEADVVWPAHSMWISLGDIHKVVRHAESILHSPIVFGVKRSVAQRLGWLDREVTVADILAAAEGGRLRFAMTSATQSNSGAQGYLGFLHALAGSPDVLLMEHLEDAAVQRKTARLLQQVNRSSGSSGWLKDLVVERYDQFDAMVNYEAMVIEANRELTAKGLEPMVAVYPADGLAIADSPMGYIDKGDAAREAAFRALQAHLKSPAIQQEILSLGRRAGIVGLDASAVDRRVFNPEWGIDVARVISPVPVPAEPVLRRALELYQEGGLRKPSATVYCLDFSGSMKGEGEAQIKQAMRLLLDREQARRFLLQPSGRDLHLVIPFDRAPRRVAEARGNDPAELGRLLADIDATHAEGGTDIYAAVQQALQALAERRISSDYSVAVLLMTDGRSQGDDGALRQALHGRETAVPVFGITFGEASDSQVKRIAALTGARVFDGRSGLVQAFRHAKGYN